MKTTMFRPTKLSSAILKSRKNCETDAEIAKQSNSVIISLLFLLGESYRLFTIQNCYDSYSTKENVFIDYDKLQ